MIWPQPASTRMDRQESSFLRVYATFRWVETKKPPPEQNPARVGGYELFRGSAVAVQLMLQSL